VVLIVLHELGHFNRRKGRRHARGALLAFLPADAVPRAPGETEYAIGAIPAGGYVKITGMNPEEISGSSPRWRAAPTTRSRRGSASW